MTKHEESLTEFLLREEQRVIGGATGMFTALLNGVRLSCKRISAVIGEGTRGGSHEQAAVQNALEQAAHGIFLDTLGESGSLAGMLSEEMSGPLAGHSEGRYLLAFDAVDGSSNIDVNVCVGTLFSVLHAPPESATNAFLQSGVHQVAAGYAIYGPTTMIVLSLGSGVHGFTLSRALGEFILTHPGLRIPPSTREFAVNTSNARFWEPPMQRYVDECVQGKDGPRGKDFTMRWIASVVAEVHRILVRGGLFMSPTDMREAVAGEGRLRLLYAANPIAYLVEQAGGAASTGRGRILEVAPQALHQRIPVIVGSRDEVEQVERYHREHDDGLDREFVSPLFNKRQLFPGR